MSQFGVGWCEIMNLAPAASGVDRPGHSLVAFPRSAPLRRAGGDMATNQSEGDGGLLIHPVVARRQKRRGLPLLLISTVLALAAAGGAVLLFRPSVLDELGGAHWLLPGGQPSMGAAERCFRERDLPCAEADLIAYLKKYPKDGRATALLALTLTQDGRHKQAITYYSKADAMGVSAYDFYAGYARSLEAIGDLDGAIRKNQEALKLVPTLIDVRGALAEEMVRKGRGPEALQQLVDYDRQLEAEGYPPYFAAQIRRIRVRLGGSYAEEAADEAATAAPEAAAPGETLVRGELDHGVLGVEVSIAGAAPSRFTVDSGASLIIIPYEDAVPLLQQGLIRPGDFRGMGMIRLADGSMVVCQIYNLRTVKVGDREIRNVPAAIYRGRGPRLLGQSFLKRFKSWSVDNGRRVLALTD